MLKVECEGGAIYFTAFITINKGGRITFKNEQILTKLNAVLCNTVQSSRNVAKFRRNHRQLEDRAISK